jgi:hypothetical protein
MTISVRSDSAPLILGVVHRHAVKASLWQRRLQMRRQIGFLAVCLLMAAGRAAAQDVLSRTVGPDTSDRPLEFRAFTGHTLGALSTAAGVPIGFEALPPLPITANRAAVTITGRTVKDAAAAMVALDPRYQWREDDGVILFEPVAPPAPMVTQTDQAMHPLDAPAPAVRLADTTGRALFAVAAALLGAPQSAGNAFGDTKAFGLDVPEGTIRALLNAIVRSHGQLVWMFEHTPSKASMFPYTLLFMSGAHGYGVGLSGRRSPGDLDPARLSPAVERAADVVDTIVGPRTDGYPLVLTAMGGSAARDLAAATQLPMGMAILSGPAPRRVSSPGEFKATGKTLKEVLDILVARDNRYEWRVVDGVVVIRPAAAWGDAGDVLFSLVSNVELQDATMTEALRKIMSALDGLDPRFSTFPDSRSVSLSVPQGTALELLTALAKAHGSLVWTIEDAEPDEVRATGRRHRLTLGVAGAVGLGVLIR